MTTEEMQALVDEVNGWRENYQRRTGGAPLLRQCPRCGCSTFATIHACQRPND